MSDFYKNKIAVVTGGAGFLASHLIKALVEAGAKIRAVDQADKPAEFPSNAEYITADLLKRDQCAQAFQGADFVFHLAAVGWGFHENLKRQPQILTDNLLLNTIVLDEAHRAGVKRYLFTSSAAVYPPHLETMDEETPWDAPPHGSEKYYAWSKRMGEIQAQAYFEHYGLPIAIVRLFNPYGPGDNFDPDKSHVIPALIRRAIARENPFTVWGTGKPIRSFIHARDAAKGMLLALEKSPGCQPINLSSDETITIGGLVKLILEVSGHSGAEIRFDTDKPDGHPRRVPSVKRAAEKLGLSKYIPLRQGLAETIEWYKNMKNTLR